MCTHISTLLQLNQVTLELHWTWMTSSFYGRFSTVSSIENTSQIKFNLILQKYILKLCDESQTCFTNWYFLFSSHVCHVVFTRLKEPWVEAFGLTVYSNTDDITCEHVRFDSYGLYWSRNSTSNRTGP